MRPIKLIVKTNSEKYPIIIGRNLISNLSEILKKNSVSFKKCLLVLDRNIPNRYVKQISKTLRSYELYKFIYNANEKNKNQKKCKNRPENGLHIIWRSSHAKKPKCLFNCEYNA